MRLTSQTILRLNRSWAGYLRLSEVRFSSSFLPSEPCFSLNTIPLNSFYSEGNPQWIGSFGWLCDRWIKDWFQFRTSIALWTRQWINTEIMQNGFEKTVKLISFKVHLKFHDKNSSTSFKQRLRQIKFGLKLIILPVYWVSGSVAQVV